VRCDPGFTLRGADSPAMTGINSRNDLSLKPPLWIYAISFRRVNRITGDQKRTELGQLTIISRNCICPFLRHATINRRRNSPNGCILKFVIAFGGICHLNLFCGKTIPAPSSETSGTMHSFYLVTAISSGKVCDKWCRKKRFSAQMCRFNA